MFIFLCVSTTFFGKALACICFFEKKKIYEKLVISDQICQFPHIHEAVRCGFISHRARKRFIKTMSEVRPMLYDYIKDYKCFEFCLDNKS